MNTYLHLTGCQVLLPGIDIVTAVQRRKGVGSNDSALSAEWQEDL
jgi:hypothetical protein